MIILLPVQIAVWPMRPVGALAPEETKEETPKGEAPVEVVEDAKTKETSAEVGPSKVTVSEVAVTPARGASVYVKVTRPDASVTEFCVATWALRPVTVTETG
jgi:hypothetical protein